MHVCMESTQSSSMLWWCVNLNIMDFSAKLYKNCSSIVLNTIPAGYAMARLHNPGDTVQFRDRYI